MSSRTFRKQTQTPLLKGMQVLLLLLLLFVSGLMSCSTSHGVDGKQHVETGDSQEKRSSLRAANDAQCGKKGGLVLQVLGSGGPIPDDDRASASYLLWQAGKAQILVDAGSGILPRFGASGAKLQDLEAIALSHLHIDHAGGLPSLLKGAYFSARKRDLPLVGPSGNDLYPSIAEFLYALIDPQKGAFRYLSGALTGDGLFKVTPVEVDVAQPSSRVLEREGRPFLQAVGVHHGRIPALGFLVTLNGTRVAFGGDQSAAGNEAFIELIQGADILVAHHAIPQRGSERIQHLHASPSQIGRMAAQANVKKLVLSHHMLRSLANLDESVAAIRKSYAGPVVIADDLLCIPLADSKD